MDCLIYTLGNKKILQARHFPVLGFEYIQDDIDFHSYELLIFTSQNAILSIKSQKEHWINKKILAVGSATKELAESMGAFNIVKTTSSNAQSMIEYNISLIKNSKTLYLRGERISFEIKNTLDDKNISIDEKIVYRSYCNINNTSLIKKNSWVILSSPFILECFCKKFDLKDYKIMIFGENLAKNMPKNSHYHVSPKSTLKDTVGYILAKV